MFSALTARGRMARMLLPNGMKALLQNGAVWFFCSCAAAQGAFAGEPWHDAWRSMPLTAPTDGVKPDELRAADTERLPIERRREGAHLHAGRNRRALLFPAGTCNV